MVEGVIFDLDGTLADTMGDLETAMNSMLTKMGYPTRTRDELLGFINNGAREFVRRSLPEEVQDSEMIINTALSFYDEAYQLCYSQKTALYEGIKEAVLALTEMGVKVAVLSNKQDRFVKNIIDKLFDKKLFSAAVGQSSLPPKPNPQIVQFTTKKMRVKTSRCIMVGDSDVDMRTAIASGMRAIGVSWGYRDSLLLKQNGADYIANKPEEIVKIVDELIKSEPKRTLRDLFKRIKGKKAKEETTEKKAEDDKEE